MMRIWTSLLSALWIAILATSSRDADAAVRTYTLAIGNDTPLPEDVASLPTLKYADDDAAAFFTFFRPLSADAQLLTVLDASSQRTFPDLGAVAKPPSLAELRRVVARWKESFEADRRAGNDPVLIFYFSGHGTSAGAGPASLVLLDGALTQSILYDEVIAALPATRVHILVDACHAEAVVRPRDGQAAIVDLSAATRQAILDRTTLARFPQAGAIVASSSTGRAYEWDAIERGVFTYELLSGLRGAADVNGDGRIEYSEIDAFLSAANREVSDPRARLTVVTHPPAVDRRAPIVDLTLLRQGATLNGAAGSLGRLSIEDERGNPLLDMRTEPDFRVNLRLPSGRLRISAARGETTLEARDGETIALADLTFVPPSATARGPLEDAIARGLFAEAYGPRYYQAYVDGRDELVPVPISVLSPIVGTERPAGRPSSRAAGWITLGAAGALAVATTVLAVETADAASQYNQTSLQREAADARSRYNTFEATAIGCGVATAVAAGVAVLLLTRGDSSTIRAASRGIVLAW